MPADSTQLKQALRRLPSGVTIVTSHDEEGNPRGLTAISVCSVSLDPPLVLACIARDTNTHAAIDDSRVFGLNFLGDAHRELADRFSGHGDKFDAVEHEVLETGAPVLSTALAACDCTVVVAIPAGDHTIFVGRVEAVKSGSEAFAPPLIRYLGRYETLPEDRSAAHEAGDPE